ncbi:MAG: hypothetical protein ACR5LC_11755 [Symbiopectobacterium sp.]|uniref:hypothetical protein n=1 Tax=Symbiopectobacterium sp. TaxID=2952789 RepID=UPI003F2DBBCF
MERAIMIIEDEVTRIRHQVNTQHSLYLCDPALTSLAETTGVPANAHGWHIEQDDIERLFKRFEQVMLGPPRQLESHSAGQRFHDPFADSARVYAPSGLSVGIYC